MANNAKPALTRKIWLYLPRTVRLGCFECGISPLYLPAGRVESISDWFTMLPGCPRCGYPYDREPGYFIFALSMINFGLVAVFGVGTPKPFSWPWTICSARTSKALTNT